MKGFTTTTITGGTSEKGAGSPDRLYDRVPLLHKSRPTKETANQCTTELIKPLRYVAKHITKLALNIGGFIHTSVIEPLIPSSSKSQLPEFHFRLEDEHQSPDCQRKTTFDLQVRQLKQRKQKQKRKRHQPYHRLADLEHDSQEPAPEFAQTWRPNSLPPRAHIYTEAPTTHIPLCGGPVLPLALQSSDQWQLERSLGGPTTDCLTLVIPEGDGDASLVLRVGKEQAIRFREVLGMRLVVSA